MTILRIPTAASLLGTLFVTGLVGGSTGCGPPKAPADIDGVSHYLYREWPDSDPAALAMGLQNLAAALAKLDLVHGLDARSFELTPPAKTDLTAITWPMERDPAKTIGSSVARQSMWPVIDHARLQASPDQVPIEPSAKTYVRTFVTPADPSCFPDRKCLEIDTVNEVTRSNALLQLTFTLHKNFRWVQVGAEWAIVGRAWVERRFAGDKGAIDQSYTADIFLGRPDGTTWRYQALWSESEIGIDVTTGTQLAVIDTTIDGAINTADTVIKTRYHAN